VIRLYPAGGGAPRTVTTGPRDFTPQFLPDGQGWLYVDGERRTIERCGADGACRTIHEGADFPFFPAPAPGSDRVAYVTRIHRPRLMLLEASGQVRDLGPARSDCPPVWSAPDRIWVLRGSERSPTWAEIDAATGAETGAHASPGPVSDDDKSCPFMLDPPRTARRDSVRAVYWEDTDLRLFGPT
jgi:hypothetical protein